MLRKLRVLLVLLKSRNTQKMKVSLPKTLLLAGLLVVIGAIASKAQTYRVEMLTPFLSAIPPNTTSNVLVMLDVRKNAGTVPLQLVTTPPTNNQGGGSLTLTFKLSVDGVNVAAYPVYTWIHAMPTGTSTNSQTIATNLSVGGFGYLALTSVAVSNNTNSLALTHLKYGRID